MGAERGRTRSGQLVARRRRGTRAASLLASVAALAIGAALPERATAAPAGPRPGEELIEREVGNTVRLPVREPSDANVAALRLPAGFRVERFATDLGTPRMLRVGEDGTVYATRPDEGDVIALRDDDGDGRAERRWTAVELDDVHDLALRGDQAYLVTVQAVYRTQLKSGALAAEPTKVLDGLPDGGRHPNRTIAFMPDGALLVSVGSTCNACVEPHPEAAALVRFRSDGSERAVFATGLRNTIGFGWHPVTQALWGMDHNTDWLGDDFPPEELNRIERGKSYGWPFVHGDGRMPEQIRRPDGFDADAFRAAAVPMVLGYTAHTAPMQLAFYDGRMFPEPYRGDAFVALHGSWNRRPPAGFEVVRIDYDASGTPLRIEPFLTGFVIENGGATFGRPTGIAVARDGALLVGDDETGVVYRVAHD